MTEPRGNPNTMDVRMDCPTCGTHDALHVVKRYQRLAFCHTCGRDLEIIWPKGGDAPTRAEQFTP